MLKSKKNVLWEALIITATIFVAGLFLGMLLETSNSNKASSLYYRSEISLVDGLAIAFLSKDNSISCESLKENNLRFADRIYEEAVILERFEQSEQLTEGSNLLHQKYDLLRTLLWMSNRESLSRCKNYNIVVYLYDYASEDLDKKATQNVWSKILLEAKQNKNDILLLPIAADQNITSLNLLKEEYKIEKLPAIVIDNKKVIYTLQNSGDIISNLE